MHMTAIQLTTACAALTTACAVFGATNSRQSWAEPYTGAEVTGPDVLALWLFEPDAPTADSSGNGHALELRGRSAVSAHGRFGACLESFTAGKDNDHAVGAATADHGTLNPAGPFTAELWLNPKPELAAARTAFLVDKKYYHYAKELPRANTGYCLYLQRSRDGGHQITASLGFGTDSVWCASDPVVLTPGTWAHIAYSYDGAGISRFFLNGQPVGKSVHEGRGPVAPSSYPLVVGDRVGSVHTGCPAFIDQVRLCKGVLPQFAGRFTVRVDEGRTVFRRMEKGAAVTVTIDNDTPGKLEQVSVSAALRGATVRHAWSTLPARTAKVVAVSVETALKPGGYPLNVLATAVTGDQRIEATCSQVVRIVPRSPPAMPVLMWGRGEFERLKYVGFTHQLESLVDCGKVWEAQGVAEAMDAGLTTQKLRRLDDYLLNGLAACAALSPGRWAARNPALEQYRRVDRAGKICPKENISASHPDLQAFVYNTGASVAQTFGQWPALDAALIHTEVRDGTAISHHDFEKSAARDALGFDIPFQALGKNGVHFSALSGFPRDRVVPDDHRVLAFYRWFWTEGDGWNQLHSKLHDGLKSTGRNNLWTFFDPAVRAPSVWGSGGSVDVLSQWTYSYPDPIKIGQATDELFAMADGRPGQHVMKMTQVIWYRSRTAPKTPDSKLPKADWETALPDAEFITIAPDHLREAFWSKISRPVRGIMYHGWGSLFPAPHGKYRHTNPQTREVLRELVRDVVRPLGPTLLAVPDRPADVALLESFASQMLASRGSFGWGHSWDARMHLILQWAALQPRIVYDEHVVRDGLAQVKVLVMPACDVLTESVVAAIHAFQNRGGLVVGDEFLCPAICPDIVIPSCGGEGKAHERKAAMLEAAAALRAELDDFYQRYADSSNPDVIPRARSLGTTDYLFAVNDHRTYGDYVGHHGRVMEKGLPSRTTLSLRRPKGHCYDLVRHCQVPVAEAKGRISVEQTLGPGEGRLLMVTQRPIRSVACSVPEQVEPGTAAAVSVRVRSGMKRTVEAVVPVRVEIRDGQGDPAEGSGYYAAPDGRLDLTLNIAPNDHPGTWTVTATELASGKQGTTTFQVR